MDVFQAHLDGVPVHVGEHVEAIAGPAERPFVESEMQRHHLRTEDGVRPLHALGEDGLGPRVLQIRGGNGTLFLGL